VDLLIVDSLKVQSHQLMLSTNTGTKWHTTLLADEHGSLFI